MNRIVNLMVALSAALLLGSLPACATTSPPQLTEARNAYQRAASGPAAQYAPAELHTAREALAAAEQAIEDGAKTEDIEDLAYIAMRRAELSEAKAGLELAEREKNQASESLRQAVVQMQRDTQTQLQQTREQLAAAQAQRQLDEQASQQAQPGSDSLQAQQQQLQEATRRLESTTDRLQQTTEQLQAAEQARMEAQKQAEQAMTELRHQGQVREEPRGTVITVPGSVVFAFGQWSLMPTSLERLKQVVMAIKVQPKEQGIIVEGHTDSIGSAKSNQVLSQRRADAVKGYLVDQGLPREQIQAVGRGEKFPVASNGTAEGRAMNRRVEIILEHERAARR